MPLGIIMCSDPRCGRAGLGLSQEEWKSVNVLLNCGSPVKRNLEEIWPHLPNLEWLHSTAAGVEHILFPALIDGPVTLTNAKAGSPMKMHNLLQKGWPAYVGL